jgi:hypothetical protein
MRRVITGASLEEAIQFSGLAKIEGSVASDLGEA